VSDIPDILTLTEVGDHKYHVFQPSESAEGRDVVFSGQLLGQMMMASDTVAESSKDIRSVHAIFARAGTYTKPIELTVDSMQAGRTWASDTVTAMQEKLLCRAMILMNIVDDDLMRHGPAMPEVASAADLETSGGQAFPGSELREIPGAPEGPGGVPIQRQWHRFESGVDNQAAAQAILTWATCGNIIGLGMRPHRDTVAIGDAHLTISTGVIGHTMHFVERFDVSQWLLIEEEATKAATGRVHGTGRVFTEDGTLVATFHQDSMAKRAAAPLDPKRSM
jgi:acyl-CoA thioesterase II